MIPRKFQISNILKWNPTLKSNPELKKPPKYQNTRENRDTRYFKLGSTHKASNFGSSSRISKRLNSSFFKNMKFGKKIREIHSILIWIFDRNDHTISFKNSFSPISKIFKIVASWFWNSKSLCEENEFPLADFITSEQGFEKCFATCQLFYRKEIDVEIFLHLRDECIRRRFEKDGWCLHCYSTPPLSFISTLFFSPAFSIVTLRCRSYKQGS